MYSKNKKQNNTMSKSENKILMHNFNSFSTSSPIVSLKIQIRNALFICLILSVIAYIVIEFLIVLNIIQNKNQLTLKNETDIKAAKLEKEYNQKIGTLTEDYALSHGFTKVDMNHFAIRLDSASNLSYLYGGER